MAGGIINGQGVDEANTNPAFLFKNDDDETFNTIALRDPSQGDDVDSIQQSINDEAEFSGRPANTSGTPSWATDNFGTSGDNLQERIEAIDLAADPETGTLVTKSGVVDIASGESEIEVTLSSPFADATYVVVPVIECDDVDPIFLICIVFDKVAAGFKVKFNAPTDSANYKLNYTARIQA